VKIGLIDVDGHNFPNLALMKISAWHKAQGDQTEMFFPMSHYDKVYMSKVFDFTPDFETCINADEVVKGGTGYGIGNYLANEIEHMKPDYSLYGITDTAYGFISRGCPRQCKFCNVSEQQGKVSKKVADLSEFWDGQKNIVLLDPNITACKDAGAIFDELIDTKAYIEFNQGLDIRLMTDVIAEKLNQLKIKMVHFAWDNYEFNTYEKLKEFRSKLKFDDRRLRVYVLTNFNTKQEQDLERIYKLRELGYDPYVMVYNKQTAPRRIKQMQRWVNNKFIFRSGQAETFEDYLKGVKP
jgi:hypothetical protein